MPTYPLLRIDPRDGATVAVETPAGTLPIRHIIGVGRNYAAHAHEQGADLPERPMFFTKNPSAASLPGDPIPIPAICADHDQVDYEGELALLIGSPATNLTEASALDPQGPVLGYTIANDVSARWWQKQGAGGQFYRGKSFAGFCPIAPITPLAQIPNPSALHIKTTLTDAQGNAEVVQDAPTSQMIFSIPRLLADLTAGTTLLPGTLILTGTPAGVGMARSPQRFLTPGDTITIEIPGLGTLTNPVTA